MWLLATLLLLLLLVLYGEALGRDGSGLTVTLERAESVLELVIELKPEAGSFWVIFTRDRPSGGASD